MRALIATCAVVLLTSCGGGDKADGAAEKPESLPTVSTATSCGQLFDGDAPVEQVVDLMTAKASVSDGPKAEALADELEKIRGQAGDELGPHVAVVETELREYADATQTGATFETGTMVTSLTELNNVCGVTPRF